MNDDARLDENGEPIAETDDSVLRFFIRTREIAGQVCGVQAFMFTHGLAYGIDKHGYRGRFCYRTRAEALAALDTWDGSGDPPGTWVKHKGDGGDRSNPNDLKIGGVRVVVEK